MKPQRSFSSVYLNELLKERRYALFALERHLLHLSHYMAILFAYGYAFCRISE